VFWMPRAFPLRHSMTRTRSRQATPSQNGPHNHAPCPPFTSHGALMWIPRPLTWILWHVAPLGQDPPWPPAPLQTRAQLVGVEEPEVCGPCLDQNRRDIGKSQSKWTDSKMETPAHLQHALRDGAGAAGHVGRAGPGGRAARCHYCNSFEAPWLVNGGHGASLRHHNHLEGEQLGEQKSPTRPVIETASSSAWQPFLGSP
jgi:hypothetical protein